MADAKGNSGTARVVKVVLGLVAGAMLLYLVLAYGLLGPAIFGSLELANRATCANNLSQIGRAGQAYAAAHKQQWPKIPYEKDAPWNEIGNTRQDQIGNTRQDQVKAGKKLPAHLVSGDDMGPNWTSHSNTVNLWTLISWGATPALFVCPATKNFRDSRVEDFMEVRDFRGSDCVSYSLQNCWGDYRLTSTGSSNSTALAIAADANPQRADFTREGGPTNAAFAKKPSFVHEGWGKTTVAGAWELNSPNHNFKGQNVLYLDGHVDWTDNPWCGVKGDNIWVMRKKDGDHNLDVAKVETLRSWDDATSYDGKKALPADSVDDSFLVP